MKRGKLERVSSKGTTVIRIIRVLALLTPCAFGAAMFALDCYGQKDRARRADAIVVLGAAVNTYGMPGPSLRARTLHAVGLYERGYAPRIIFTGGLGNYPPTEAEAAAALAMRRGVPSTAILTEKTSTSTWENVVNTAEICRRHNIRAVIVVSDPYHLWRAERNFTLQNIRAYPSPSPNREDGSRFYMTTRETLLVLRDLVWRRSS